MRHLLLLLCFLPTLALSQTAIRPDELHSRLEAVCPIESVSIGTTTDKTTWRFQAKASSTAPQRAAAQAVIDAWTDNDWDGTPNQRRAKALEKIVLIHTRRAALTIERNYWTGQGNAARADALQTMLDAAQTQIDALRPQS